MIALLDYGSGNLRSVEKALKRTGADVRVTTHPKGMRDAKGIVLPGVGAFDDCISALQKQDLFGSLQALTREGRPFLGICVGYQALFERSEEFNSRALGLSLFPGKVVRFRTSPGLKVPQIGWNQLELAHPNCPLFEGVSSGSYVYFVHSFFPKPTDSAIVASWTTYGERFASAIWKDHLFATQFHPEKSQRVGLKVLENFVRTAKSA